MLRDEPTLDARQALAMRAWQDLMGDRVVTSEAMGPIYWRAIVTWCDRYGVADSESFIELVQWIDREYLRADSPRPTAAANPKRSGGETRH